LKQFIFLIFIITIIFSCSNIKKNGFLKTETPNLYDIDYDSFYSDFKENEDIVFSFVEKPQFFNPYRVSNKVENFVRNALFSTLFYLNPKDNTPKENIIKKFDVSSDRLTYIFTILPDVRFSDGQLLTTADVVSSLSLVKTILKDSNYYKGFFLNNTNLNFEIISPVKFNLILDKPNENILYMLSIFPIIKKETADLISLDVEKFISIWNDPKYLIGTGPYVLNKYNDSILNLEKNKFYFKKDKNNRQLPYTNKISINITENSNLEIIDFINNGSDIMELSTKDFNTLYEYYAKDDKIKFVDAGFDSKKCFLVYNTLKTYLKDKNLREYIVNSILTDFNNNNYTLSLSIFKFNNKLKTSDYTFYDSNNDGVIEGKDKNPIVLNLIAPEENGELVNNQDEISKILQKQKISIKAEVFPYYKYLEKLFYKKDFDIALVSYDFDFSLVQANNLINDSNFNFFQFSENEEVKNKILSLYNTTILQKDYQKQQQNLSEIADLIEQDFQLSPVLIKKIYYIMNNDIFNLKINNYSQKEINLTTLEHIVKIVKK